jgi:hypothetical protein
VRHASGDMSAQPEPARNTREVRTSSMSAGEQQPQSRNLGARGGGAPRRFPGVPASICRL